MGQPVKLSDSLVVDARLAGEIAERSIASQIEFWARIGRATDLSLRTAEVLRLKQRGEDRPLSECLASVDTGEGRRRLAAHLASRPYPHFEATPGGLLVRIEADGTRALGRFVNREFRPVKSK